MNSNTATMRNEYEYLLFFLSYTVSCRETIMSIPPIIPTPLFYLCMVQHTSYRQYVLLGCLIHSLCVRCCEMRDAEQREAYKIKYKILLVTSAIYSIPLQHQIECSIFINYYNKFSCNDAKRQSEQNRFL
jgi:hypothetical protein